MFHMVTVFPLSWVFLFTNESPARFLVIESVAAAFGVLAIIASGYLADRVGRRTLLGASASAIAVFSGRSEEHTSELQSLMRISYAVFCLKKKTNNRNKTSRA